MTIDTVSFSPDVVIESHQRAMETRLVTSVVPEVTDIEIDTALLTEVASALGATSFSRTKGLKIGPNNLLADIDFVCVNGKVRAVEPDDMNPKRREPIQALRPAIAAVDEHFRAWHSLSRTVALMPGSVNLIGGVWTGKASTDTNRHFDFKRRAPVVSYKNYFEGDPAHASVYYPGDYRLPRTATVIGRVLGGGVVDPIYPTPLFKKRDAVRHVMPARVTTMEPWNAYHSGPTDKQARGTRRGILGVSYNVAALRTI